MCTDVYGCVRMCTEGAPVCLVPYSVRFRTYPYLSVLHCPRYRFRAKHPGPQKKSARPQRGAGVFGSSFDYFSSHRAATCRFGITRRGRTSASVSGAARGGSRGRQPISLRQGYALTSSRPFASGSYPPASRKALRFPEKKTARPQRGTGVFGSSFDYFSSHREKKSN